MSDETELARCPDVDLIVVDNHRARFALAVDDWNATTLLACVSEDPSDWHELAGVWPRYRSDSSFDDAESLNLSVIDVDAAMMQLSEERAWIFIDLRTKRICFGRANDPMERDGCYAMDAIDGYEQEFRIPIHLPPWWEFHRHVDLSMVYEPRCSELSVFHPRRDVLWGSELANGLAERMINCFFEDDGLRELLFQLSSDFSDPEPLESDEEVTTDRFREMRNELHSRTVAVHRDWLMTPRSDLDGRMPRQCLHGAVHWIDRVIEGQKRRVSGDAVFTPIPIAMANDPRVRMGRSEVCLYFDLCRELIHAGWVHLSLCSDEMHTGSEAIPLASHLEKVQENWMRMPHEGGDSAAIIIDVERHRVPRILDSGPEGAAIDCDCPICEMMKEGNFGPTFVGIDGHHLELDNEFAFSLLETREEWDDHRREYEELSLACELPQNAIETSAEEPDEFGSVWKNSYVGKEGIPGDFNGNIEISFLLADMIGSLKQLKANDAIIELNEAFRAYRIAGRYELAIVTEHFQRVLESVAQQYSGLVGRSADLQQRLDELARQKDAIDSDDEFPY